MRTAIRVLGTALLLAAIWLVPSTAANATPVEMEITDAVLNLGNLSGVKAIDSSISDPPATLSGEIDGTAVSIPKAGFVFPPKSAEVAPGFNAMINMEANSDITGNFDAGDGRLDLTVSLKATVAVAGSTCVISPINLSLSTQNGKPYLGVPFAAGISETGALSARWSGLPPVTGGGFCGTVAGLIAGPGGIWMANGISTPQTCTDQPSHPGCDPLSPDLPEKEPKITGGPNGTTSETTATFTFTKGDGETQEVTGFLCSLDEAPFEACDSGTKEYTGLAKGTHKFSVRAKNAIGEGPSVTRTWGVVEESDNKDPAKLGALKVTPKAKSVKRGKKVTITVKVKNIGDSAAAGTKICLTAPKKLIKGGKCMKVGNVAAGKTGTAKFKLTVSKKAKKGKKAVLKVKASASGLAAATGKATIKFK